MDTKTVFLILLAAIVSIAVVLFQYFYKSRRSSRLNSILSVLRFVAIFSGLLLLVNPRFVKDNFYVEKSKLLVLMDNSSSMVESTSLRAFDEHANSLKNDATLKNRFEILQYGFGANFHPLEVMTFSEKETDIHFALQQAAELSGNENAVVVLLTDGNQTVGNDYQYLNFGQSIEVNAVVLGDTTRYQDLSVRGINSNKYSFLGNQFPVEATINYQGDQSISAAVQILLDGKPVYRENLTFSKNESSKSVSTTVLANSVGTKSLAVDVGRLQNEKNTNNNRKETAIEVIDEKTRIAIVSSFLHPDIGALKKSLETNEQRSVVITKPNVDDDFFEDIEVVILYQPISSFEKTYQAVQKRNIPTVTITGTRTDLNYLNRKNETRFSVEIGYPEQELFGTVNRAFPHFDVTNLNLEGYPPLLGNAGTLTFKKEADVLFNMEIKGAEMDSPLMALWNESETKHAVLFGENIWQWRAQDFRNQGSFVQFDNFFGKLILYLSQSGTRERLELDYEKVYEGVGRARIRASFFDEIFVSDDNANLLLTITNNDTEEVIEIPMLFKGTYHEALLGNLSDGTYTFTVTETKENISKSGTFKILEFDAEKQFLTADHQRLNRLAENNGGNIYFSDQTDVLLENLKTANQYVPIQKNSQKVVPLIDFKVLLAIMVLALAFEWIIRKYNGLL